MSDKFSEEHHQIFIDALFDCKGNVSKAAAQSGYSVRQAYNLFHGDLRTRIAEKAEGILALYAMRAAFTLTDAIDEDSTIPTNPLRLDAAKQILDRIGVVKKEKIEISGDKNSPLFILPAKDNVSKET